MRSTISCTPGPNPFANLRLERSRGRKDLIALTEDELTELCVRALDVLGEFGPTFRAMIVFSAYVGLRPGELFALERSDVGRDEVAIRQNLDGTGTIKAPKNGRERIVVLPPPLARRWPTYLHVSTFRGSSSRREDGGSRSRASTTTGTRCEPRSVGRG